jgi:hypothetical protein
MRLLPYSAVASWLQLQAREIAFAMTAAEENAIADARADR